LNFARKYEVASRRVIDAPFEGSARHHEHEAKEQQQWQQGQQQQGQLQRWQQQQQQQEESGLMKTQRLGRNYRSHPQ